MNPINKKITPENKINRILYCAKSFKATFIQPSIFSTQYLLKIKYFEEEPT